MHHKSSKLLGFVSFQNISQVFRSVLFPCKNFPFIHPLPQPSSFVVVVDVSASKIYEYLLGLFLQPTLMHNSITTCMSHYYPRHVSGLDMPILRRNNCTNTADCSPLSTGVVYSRLEERGYQMLCLCSCSS